MSGAAAPRWLLWVSILLIVWNAIGVAMFAATMMRTPADMAALPQDQQLLWAQMPMWGIIGFAVGTIGGLIAAIGIFMKKKWAVPLAVLSVIDVVANFTPTFAMSKGVDVWQAQFYAFPIIIMVLALLQLWLARKSNASGWAS